MSEETRTVSATGGEKGVKAEKFSLLPRAGLAAIARVFGFGAQKYSSHNWRKGYEWSLSFDALERHIQAAKDGETYDAESGEPHLAHAGFHILALLTWLEEQGEGPDNPMDDRWPAVLERARRAKEASQVWDPFADGDLRDYQDQINRIIENFSRAAREVGLDTDEDTL